MIKALILATVLFVGCSSSEDAPDSRVHYEAQVASDGKLLSGTLNVMHSNPNVFPHTAMTLEVLPYAVIRGQHLSEDGGILLQYQTDFPGLPSRDSTMITNGAKTISFDVSDSAKIGSSYVWKFWLGIIPGRTYDTAHSVFDTTTMIVKII